MAPDPNGRSAQQKRMERESHRRAADLSRASIEVRSGGGLVRLRIDGLGRVRGLDIAPDIFQGRDPDLLADLIMAALAEGQRRADELAAGAEPDATGVER